jgi:hypothetical protein
VFKSITKLSFSSSPPIFFHRATNADGVHFNSTQRPVLQIFTEARLSVLSLIDPNSKSVGGYVFNTTFSSPANAR